MIEQGKKCNVAECSYPVVARDLCQKHYMRWSRHGHVHETRAVDWGSREKHPLYVSWIAIRRRYGLQGMCSKWHDFWVFAEEVGKKPEGKFYFTRKDNALPWSLENVYWKERGFAAGNEKEYQRSYRKNNPRQTHNSMLKRFYGITVEDYERMWNEQNGVCKICGKPEKCTRRKSKEIRRLAVDHCHNSNKIRGLLCTDCNTAIGSFKDDLGLLEKAIAYLKSYS